jgi:molybdenum cofactor cytidylyltransferase
MKSTFSVIILASGLSERMGEPKALLKWDNSKTFLEKIINEYIMAGCSRIVCMVNIKTEPFCRNLKIPKNVKFVINPHPEWGRFYSIRTGSQEVLDSDYCFIQNVDNPFVQVEIIEKLYSQRSSEAWCSPVFMGKGGHPVLLPQFIIQKINKVDNLDLTLLDVLKPCRRISVETDSDTILRNINTPEEYKKYFT